MADVNIKMPGVSSLQSQVDDLYNAPVVPLVSGASIALTDTKHSLITALAAITFTITYSGDEIVVSIVLNAVSSVLTFPSGSLCISNGIPSGDNTCTISGASGDNYFITIKNVGVVYYVTSTSFGQ